MSISVLGAGSWGSALAMALGQISDVVLWSRNKDQVLKINEVSENKGYLPEGIKFPQNILATSDLPFAVNHRDLLIIAVPLAGFRSILLQINQLIKGDFPDIIWVCKGIEVDSGLLPHQIIQNVLGTKVNAGALLGPSFAKEVAEGLPTAVSLVSNNREFARKWIKLFSKINNFRVYAHDDLVGAEIGAAVKNVIAIASGISDGLGFGHNARAALITRGLHEIAILVRALNGKLETIYGLSGIGDLVLTCTGDLSRNKMVGLSLASGLDINAALINLGYVAEGVYTTKGIYNLALKLELEMPIVEAIYNIIYCQANIKDIIEKLLNREPKFEFGFI